MDAAAIADEIDKPVTPYAAEVDLAAVDSPPNQPQKSSLRSLVCSKAFALALVVVAELLTVAWYVVVPFVVDNSSLRFDYMFAPRSTTAFWIWRIMALVLVALAFLLLGYALFTSETTSTGLRLRPFAVCVMYIVLLIVGNIIGVTETSARKSHEDAFAVQFNTFYCNARALRVCLEGSDSELLLLTRGNATTVLASENPTNVALSVWGRCQGVLLDGMAKAAKRTNNQYRKRDGEKGIETKEVYRLLDDTKGSTDVDAWCGNAYHYSLSLTTAQQKTLPSPFASNPSIYARYKREWTRRMQFSNAFLGGAVVLLVVVMCISW